MSDTPRTDAECGWYDSNGVRHPEPTGDHVDPAFARQLERELNAANQEIERLSGVIETMGKGTTESQWRMVKDAEELEGKCRDAMERMKLLERLGDNMAEYMVDGREVDDWKNANRESWKRRDEILNRRNK